MFKHNQSGAISGVVVSLVLTFLLLVGAMAFGFWAFSSRQDYKNNVDSKISVAVAAAQKKQFADDQQHFNEEAKNPLATYIGPQAYGSMVVKYPKTWSAYVDDSSSGFGGNPINSYFAPGVLPALGSSGSVFSLRVQVLHAGYAQIVSGFGGPQKRGAIKVNPYALPKLPSVVGVEVTGRLSKEQPNVTLVALPLRSNTVEIWTEGNQFINDFNNYILPNFSFSP